MIFTDGERNELNKELTTTRVPFMLNRIIKTQCLVDKVQIDVGHSEVTLVKVILMHSDNPFENPPSESFFFKTKEGNLFSLPEHVALNLCIGLKEIVDKLTTQYESRAFQKAGEQAALAKKQAEAADKAVVENSINEQSLNNWGKW